jgi:hypothetical protein
MKHARPTAPRTGQLYAPGELAAARNVLTHAHSADQTDPTYSRAKIENAWVILHADRAFRIPKRRRTTTTPRVLRVPLAVFQAGPIRLHRKPRHRITLGPTTPPTTPGEAA